MLSRNMSILKLHIHIQLIDEIRYPRGAAVMYRTVIPLPDIRFLVRTV